MARNIAVVLSFVLGLSFAVSAQKKTIDNFDLEKYRQHRVKADQDYRDNYDKMGFPSPEELARQIKEDEDERIALGDKLREERLELERIRTERMHVAAEMARYNAEIEARDSSAGYSDGYYPGFIGTFDTFGGKFHGRRHSRNAPRFRATPVGVYEVPRERSRIRTPILPPVGRGNLPRLGRARGRR